MKSTEILWNPEKDELLRMEPGRGGIGLSECAVAIEEGRILDDIQSPNRPNQRMFILDIEGYAYVVPYVFKESSVFLKTMFPSRDYTAKYLRIRQ
jgi:hypothetical protein